MNGKVDGKNVVIQAFDFVPRADLAVELFDDGESEPVAYRAPHALTRGGHPDERGREVRGEGVERRAGLPVRAAPTDRSCGGAKREGDSLRIRQQQDVN